MGAGENITQRRHWVERIPFAGVPGWAALGATLAFCLLALWARMAMTGFLPVGYPFVTFFPAVMLASFLFGARHGLLAGLLSGLLAWYFFVPHANSFTLAPGAWAALLLYAVVVGTQVAVMFLLQTVNARLARERERNRVLAETREMLFRELQHRVSNNLQVAAGLLTLQKKQVGDGAAHSALDEAARRLAVIGRISRQLYESDGGTRGMRAFLEPLCADVVEMSGRAGLTIDFHAEEDVQLASDAALPLALIVAESVANAIEHGLAGRETAAIQVVLGRDAAGAPMVEVRDDGCGLPEGFDLASSSSLGLRIARTFAEQLGGRFELVRGEGTTARVVLAG